MSTKQIALSEAMIPTARGDAVPASELGFTHSAELIIQQTGELVGNWPNETWESRPEEEQIARVVDILNAAYEGGVNTIVERTIVGIGRNVERMQKVAKQTKMNILICSGFYTLHSLPYFFRYRKDKPEDFVGRMLLEDYIVQDVLVGINRTNVRAAAIKVMSDKYGLEETPDLRSLFKSCSIAHRRSGAPLTTHGLGAPDGLKHQRIFAEEGVDLTRVALCHMDRSPANTSLDEFQRILDKGSFISFDGWFPSEETNVLASDSSTPEQNFERIVDLVGKGYGEQILLAGGWPIAYHDCFPDSFGIDDDIAPYMRVKQQVIPELKSRGLSDEQIHLMTNTNPQRWAATLAMGEY
ncbi:MAG TPA: hypothetical protein VJS38_19750 [Phenylobacterium sp.]|uniref:phosphotriesterase family protein n=1 Tax=Phenylobacterium sp. TaxID=1871053 RepID=UPI002B47B0CB|nr:hypothetical protein [Phenylobacterium sp.]HKR90409.1 hypothetical protein [Phenylobacterium sp.]